MHLYKKKRGMGAVGIFVTLAIFLAFAFFAFKEISKIPDSMSSNDADLLKDALDNAVITCYAIEGSYPESLEYIEEHYGIIIDREKFFVEYDTGFVNMRPGISVYIREDK